MKQTINHHENNISFAEEIITSPHVDLLLRIKDQVSNVNEKTVSVNVKTDIGSVIIKHWLSFQILTGWLQKHICLNVLQL